MERIGVILCSKSKQHVIEDERVSSLTWEEIIQEQVESGRNNDSNVFDF